MFKEYKRVTEIISPFTGVEFIPAQYLEPAAEKGTKIHGYIEEELKGFGRLIFDEETKGYMNSFFIYLKENRGFLKDIILEKRFYCDELNITGQIDVIVKHEDKTYLIDWKSSSKTYKYWGVQGAAYAYLCKKNGYENIENLFFVRLKKDGSKPTVSSYDYQSNLDIFLKCHELYNFFEMEKTRKKI